MEMNIPKLTNRQEGYLVRLRDRFSILHSRIRDGSQQLNYITEWKMELHALEWAIAALEAWPDKERVVQPEEGSRNQVIEECAKLCEHIANGYGNSASGEAIRLTAVDIRDLKDALLPQKSE